MRRRTLIALAPILPLISVLACGNIWGFNDLKIGDAGTGDATVGDGSRTDAPMGDGAGDDANGEDSSATDAESSGDADLDAHVGPDTGLDAESEAATVVDAGKDVFVPPSCSTICATGCCDANGICQAGNATKICGKGGSSCQSCTQSCPLFGPCCSSTGTCACNGALGCP